MAARSLIRLNSRVTSTAKLPGLTHQPIGRLALLDRYGSFHMALTPQTGLMKGYNPYRKFTAFTILSFLGRSLAQKP